MATPTKPFESESLQNSSQLHRITTNNIPSIPRPGPMLPPLPRSSSLSSTCNSYMPYSSGYNSYGYGGYSGYSGYGMPYRSPYSSYGNGMYNMGMYPSSAADDSEWRFIQFAEERSRNTFANVENFVRAINSISMMLDNTFFAMTSSFRAVLSVAENFGRLRNMFGHIWQTISLFRLFTWIYRKCMALLGHKVPRSAASVAWKQATNGGPIPPATGSNWPTFAFLGVLVSAPYIISKFLPKYQDPSDPAHWKTIGVRAKAAFDFAARAQNELSIQTNDEITLAPAEVQEKMSLKNSGWVFAVCNGRSGLVPLNYLVIHKTKPPEETPMPVPKVFNNSSNGTVHKSALKKVSFGENQIFENVDLEDYLSGKKECKMTERSEKEISHKDLTNVVEEGLEGAESLQSPNPEEKANVEVL